MNIPDSIESAIAKLASKEFLNYLVSKIPWLAWKFVNPIIGWVIQYVISKIIKHTVLGVNILFLDSKIDGQTDALNAAIEKAKAITPETSKEEMDKIDAEITEAARKLIDFTRTRAKS